MKNTSHRTAQSPNQIQQILERQIAAQPSFEPFGIWLAINKSDQSLVGWFMLRPDDSGKIELGFMLPQKSWGLGYATEVAGLLVQHYKNTNTKKILMAKTDPNNFASQNVLTKIGFKFIKNIFSNQGEENNGAALAYYEFQGATTPYS